MEGSKKLKRLRRIVYIRDLGEWYIGIAWLPEDKLICCSHLEVVPSNLEKEVYAECMVCHEIYQMRKEWEMIDLVENILWEIDHLPKI